MIKARIPEEVAWKLMTALKGIEVSTLSLAALCGVDTSVIRSLHKLGQFDGLVTATSKTEFWYVVPDCINIVADYIPKGDKHAEESIEI